MAAKIWKPNTLLFWNYYVILNEIFPNFVTFSQYLNFTATYENNNYFDSFFQPKRSHVRWRYCVVYFKSYLNWSSKIPTYLPKSSSEVKWGKIHSGIPSNISAPTYCVAYFCIIESRYNRTYGCDFRENFIKLCGLLLRRI